MIRTFVHRAGPVWFVLTAVLVWLIAIAGIGWLLQKSLLVIMMLVIGSLLALMLDPLIKLISHRTPRWTAILLVYLGIVGLLVTVGFLVIPLVVKQARDFPREIPILQARAQSWADNSPTVRRALYWYENQASDNTRRAVQEHLGQLNESGAGVARSVIDVMLGTLKWAFHGVIILVISIYLLLDKQNFINWFFRVTPVENRERLLSLFNDLIGVLQGYLRGLTLMIAFVCIAVSTILKIEGNHYWLFIGCMAGLLEVIPYFGAVAGAVPAVSMAFAKDGAGWGLGLIAYFVLINQVEGHVVAPLAMGHSMHMRPLAVLLSLLVGAEVDGVIGMIIGVPVVGMVRVLWVHASRYLHQPVPADQGRPPVPEPDVPDLPLSEDGQLHAPH